MSCTASASSAHLLRPDIAQATPPPTACRLATDGIGVGAEEEKGHGGSVGLTELVKMWFDPWSLATLALCALQDLADLGDRV